MERRIVMAEKPNLFDFATSELSQDAFLAWLIQYADYRCADDVTGAHSAGRQFLDLAFERNLPETERPTGDLTVKVLRQHYHIDVFAEIIDVATRKKYVLLLEDKVGTTVHDNQLKRYRETVQEKYGDSTQVCVYCQTHNESVNKTVADAGFCQMNRKDLLAILSKFSCNQIIELFAKHLKNLEDGTNEWKELPPYDDKGNDQWSWLSWQGFFMTLRKELNDGAWGYVPNPGGGFLGFWWHWRKIDGGSLYLQLEQRKACFKVEVDDDVDAGEKKGMWNALVVEKASEVGISAIKPPVMRKGAWMTVAILNGDYRKVNDDRKCVDIKSTVAELRKMEDVVLKVSGS